MNTQEKIEALAAGEWFKVHKMDRLYAMDSDHKVVYYDTCWPEGSKWRMSHGRGFERDLPRLKPYTQPESEVLDTLDKVHAALLNNKELIQQGVGLAHYKIIDGELKWFNAAENIWKSMSPYHVTRLLTGKLLNSTIHDPDAVTIPNPKEVAE